MMCGIKPWYPIDIIKIIVVEGRSNMFTIACRTFIQTAVRMTVNPVLHNLGIFPEYLQSCCNKNDNFVKYCYCIINIDCRKYHRGNKIIHTYKNTREYRHT